MQWEPVSHNLQSAVVNPMWCRSKSRTITFVRTRAPPGTHARLHSRMGTPFSQSGHAGASIVEGLGVKHRSLETKRVDEKGPDTRSPRNPFPKFYQPKRGWVRSSSSASRLQVANLQPTLPKKEAGQTERCFTDSHAFNVVRWVVRDDAFSRWTFRSEGDACSPWEHNQPNCSSNPNRRDLL